MKRSSSTLIPELSAPPHRKRALSEEERALWESVAKQTKPLRKKARGTKPHVASPDSKKPAMAKAVAPPKPSPALRMARTPKPNPAPAAPPLAPPGRRERSQLSRRPKHISTPPDLHATTQTPAP